MGNKQSWRTTKDNKNFIETELFLRQEIIEWHSETPLRLCVVGSTGAGKSSFINSIFSASRGRICDMSREMNVRGTGVGTHVFRPVASSKQDLFHNVVIFDSMGLTEAIAEDNNHGITTENLKCMCEGRIPPGHTFNQDTVDHDGERTYQPHCVIFVISADTLLEIEKGSKAVLAEKLQKLHSIIPEEIASVTVITKCDRICPKVTEDIEYIYKSRRIHEVVGIATKLFGVAENKVFPAVNYITQIEVDKKLNVPILYPLLFALNFSSNRKEVEDALSD